jgi:hypothetical protein
MDSAWSSSTSQTSHSVKSEVRIKSFFKFNIVPAFMYTLSNLENFSNCIPFSISFVVSFKYKIIFILISICDVVDEIFYLLNCSDISLFEFHTKLAGISIVINSCKNAPVKCYACILNSKVNPTIQLLLNSTNLEVLI